MISSRLFIAIYLALRITGSAVEAPAEKVFEGKNEGTIWVESPKPRVKMESRGAFNLNLDFQAHGALSLATVSAEVRTEASDVPLSLDPSSQTQSFIYDKDSQELQLLLPGQIPAPWKLSLPAFTETQRVLLRRRDQLALFVILPHESRVIPVWFGTVNYVIRFRNAAQYELCRGLQIKMGTRAISADEFQAGIILDTLDEIADVTVTGTDPGGEPFAHRYTFDFATLEKLLDRLYASFFRAAAKSSSGTSSAPTK